MSRKTQDDVSFDTLDEALFPFFARPAKKDARRLILSPPFPAAPAPLTQLPSALGGPPVAAARLALVSWPAPRPPPAAPLPFRSGGGRELTVAVFRPDGTDTQLVRLLPLRADRRKLDIVPLPGRRAGARLSWTLASLLLGSRFALAVDEDEGVAVAEEEVVMLETVDATVDTSSPKMSARSRAREREAKRCTCWECNSRVRMLLLYNI